MSRDEFVSIFIMSSLFTFFEHMGQLESVLLFRNLSIHRVCITQQLLLGVHIRTCETQNTEREVCNVDTGSSHSLSYENPGYTV